MSKNIDYGLIASLRKVYGSLTYSLLDKILLPPKRLYLRVNTMLITREELVERLKKRGINVKEDPYVEEAVFIELEGPNKIPVYDKKIIVDKYAAESIMIGANLYRPGIVRFDRFKENEYVNIQATNGRIIAVVRTLVSSDKLKYMKKGIVGENIVSIYKAPPIRDLEEYDLGLFYPQSLPAMMVSRILDPQPGELIFDMNAAPGGKTSHLVQLSQGRSRIIAFERNVKKALKVYSTLKRLRLLRNVIILPMDSRYVHLDLNVSEKVDKILIDPPCTGLGVRPKIDIDIRGEDIVVLSKYQRQFLNSASTILTRKGIIVYSTCTLTWEENEENIIYAVRKLGLETIDLGKIPYADKIYYRDIVAYRFSPLGYDMPGFFVAVLRRK
ncbi:Fmu (Sun) domain protein [Staphylothermus marinus F1]|uniref:tRNA (cytosine(72)-C(5))-methyltransferase n=1 Tax=Staphylothermus marinus (strain ATCC 43588 / DSM 3639 / JCM 9404 / F1) TaxID=399550 RepID=A3DMG8_STAMF|nr:RsmB/NOP family class I SAM-dependent RNA methyltransferase [Staphylothermus marinus]ABN69828.1 Fmu (Sun) domain protein [Staphylothermus marinus F1]